jgi:2-furoyl-CoA dehydrogenase large subunit
LNAPVDPSVAGAATVGTPVERVEDLSLLTGTGLFGDDLPVRGNTLYAAILRSPHAHAEIVSIDASKALARPGVAAVITGPEVRAATEPFIVGVKAPIDDWALAVDRVRYVGEPVAVVVASDRYKAEDALDAIEVVYAPLAPAVDPHEAMRQDAPLLHPACNSNVVHDRSFRYGDPESAFAAAAHRVSIEVEYPRVLCAPMEGYVVLADYSAAEDSYDVVANFQGPFSVLTVVPRALRVPGNRLRLRTPPNSGGSFGSKLAIFPYIVLVCLASKRTGRPVKWVEDRLEHLAASGSGPYRQTRIEAAVARDGEVLALSCDHLEEYGACLRAPMPGPLYRMHGVTTGAYAIRNLTVRNRIVLTNKVPVSLVRGFGGPQIYLALERLMHRIAVELGLDPLAVIRRNLVPANAFPYRTAAGALLDSGNYAGAIDKAVTEGGLDALRARRDAMRAEGRLYGIGLACVVEPGVSNMGYLSTLLPLEARRKSGPKDGAIGTATVAVDGNGMVTVVSDSTPQGQGHRTVLAQVVGDELGLKPEDIAVNVELDTSKDGWSIAAGNYASRFAASTCSAAYLAAGRIRKRLAAIAGNALGVPADDLAFRDGMIFSLQQPAKRMPFYRVAGMAHWSPGSLPDGVAPGLRETAQWSPPQLAPPTEGDEINTSLTYGFIFDFCGIEIDRNTGAVRVDRYVSIHDSGRILNPALAEGQIRGALAQAFGTVLYENFAYGPDGSLLTGTFADYLLPTAMEIPDVELLHIETPSPFTPLGAKGMGEGNTMSVPACLSNAIADALGVRHVALPILPARIAEMLHGEEPRPPAAAEQPAPLAAPAGRGHGLTGRGDTFVPAPPERVWAMLLDPASLRGVIPGCESLDAIGEHAYRAVARVGVGPVRGRFTAETRFTGLDAPRRLAFTLAADGPLGASRGAGTVSLVREADGTRVHYDYGVDLSGKIAAVGSRMLESASRVLIGAFFQALAARAGPAADAAGAAAPPAAAPLGWWRRLLRFLGVNP